MTSSESSGPLRDYVQAWLAGSAPPAPIARLLGIGLLESGNGAGVAELQVEARHHNAMGTAHGGIFCDLADVAIGAAVVSVLAPDETFLTIALSVDFLSAVRSERLVARATITKRGAQVTFCECRVETDSGRHVAQVRANCLIRRLEPTSPAGAPQAPLPSRPSGATGT